VLSWFAHDPDEFWAVTGRHGGAARVAPGRSVGGGTGAGEARSDGGDREVPGGDVYRIPAQAQLAWGRA